MRSKINEHQYTVCRHTCRIFAGEPAFYSGSLVSVDIMRTSLSPASQDGGGIFMRPAVIVIIYLWIRACGITQDAIRC